MKYKYDNTNFKSEKIWLFVHIDWTHFLRNLSQAYTPYLSTFNGNTLNIKLAFVSFFYDTYIVPGKSLIP